MPSRLSANDFLWPRLRPAQAPLAFRARGPAAAASWRARARPELARLLGFQEPARTRPRARLLERVERDDVVREKHLLRTSARSAMPFYLLLPKRVRHPAVVIAYHGHGYGAKDAVGLWEDGSERLVPDGYHRDFALALCRLGFAVAVPEIACFGERQNDHSALAADAPVPSSCHQSAALAMHLGGSVLGLRVLEARRLADWLRARPDLDGERLGAMGISGGGALCLLHAALDQRVRAAVISGYLCDWRDSIFAVAHCSCNYVPGLARFGGISDVAGLVAPRPLLAEAGERDPLFPLAGVRRAAARLRAIYARSGAGGAARLSVFPGRHRIDGRAAYPFLVAALAAPP